VGVVAKEGDDLAGLQDHGDPGLRVHRCQRAGREQSGAQGFRGRPQPLHHISEIEIRASVGDGHSEERGWIANILPALIGQTGAHQLTWAARPVPQLSR
jgi:hypothetical protein